MTLALLLGILMAVRVPFGQVADEPTHILRADSLLQGEWIGHRERITGPNGESRWSEGVIADRSLLDVLLLAPRPLDTTPTRISAAAISIAKKIPSGKPQFSEIGTIASYAPLFYVPAAAAIGMARALALGPYDEFLAARIANLLTCVALGAGSLLLARSGRAVLFATLLLPLSLNLMASANQDGLLIATAALAVALASGFESGAPWRQRRFIGAFICVAAVCLAKPPYLPIAALLFLPCGSSWRRLLPGCFLERLAGVLIVAAIAATWTTLNVKIAAVPVHRAPTAAGPLWPGTRPAIFAGTDMAAQLDVLVADPWRLIWLPVHTMLSHPAVFRQIVDALGWLNLRLPSWFVGLWAFALVYALACESVVARVRQATPFPRFGPRTGLLVCAVFAAVLLIYISQYLSFTPVGWDWISGPQGRYLVPLLPLLGLASAERRRDRTSERRVWVAITPTIVAAVVGVFVIPLAITAFYYDGGR